MNNYHNNKKTLQPLWKGIHLFHQVIQKPQGIVNSSPPKEKQEIVLLSHFSIQKH